MQKIRCILIALKKTPTKKQTPYGVSWFLHLSQLNINICNIKIVGSRGTHVLDRDDRRILDLCALLIINNAAFLAVWPVFVLSRI
jgi:hypothetical protein